MKHRTFKFVMGLVLILSLIPVFSAHAATGADTSNIAQSTKGMSTTSFYRNYTQQFSVSGDIVVNASFTNTSSTNGTYIYFHLYRESGSSSIHVGGASVYLTPGQSSSLNTTLAYGQPAGTYRLEVSSPYAVIGGLSFYPI